MNTIEILIQLLINNESNIQNTRLFYIEDIEITQFYKNNINNLLNFAMYIDIDYLKDKMSSYYYNLLVNLNKNAPKNFMIALVDDAFVTYKIESNDYNMFSQFY